MSKPDDLTNLIADLQRQRKQLEENLDDTDRSRESTAQIVEKIIDLKHRAAAIQSSATGSSTAKKP